MEDLTQLMEQLDLISKSIPEGNYLKMCNNLKNIHMDLRDRDPPVMDSRRPRAAAPFQVVQPGVDVHRLINVVSDSESDDEPWEPEWYDEWRHNEGMIRRLLDDLKIAKASLRTLKPIQRNTGNVREAAMRHFTSHTPILDMDIFDENMAPGRRATFENYVRITNWADYSPADRKEYTSKKFEKQIYEDYKMVENHRIERLISEAMELRRNLEIEISDVRDRQSYLRVHYNIAPRG